MTLNEHVRNLIADKDATNYLFTNAEIDWLIARNLIYQRFETEPVAPYAYKVKSPYTMFEQPNGYKVSLGDGTTVPSSDVTFIYLSKNMFLSNTVDTTQPIYVEGYFLDEDNLRADAFEMIASDFRKLQNYAVQNINGNLSDAKEHLFRMARYFRTPR